MNALVSVVMPVYNVEKYLSKAIKSVLNQKYKSLELIIVIDGSPDNSYKIAKSYEYIDNRIKVLYKENGGLSDARNYGMKYAKGKYIYFIDSDDYIDSILIYDVVELAESKNLDVVVFGYNTDFEDEYGELKNTIKISPKNGIFNIDNIKQLTIDDDFFNYIGYAWNKLYRLSYLLDNQMKFYKGLSLIEDIEFNYRVLGNINSIAFINKCYYHYIQRNRITLVNSRYDKFYEMKLEAVKYREKLLKMWGFEDSYINKVISELYLGALNSGLKQVSLNKELDFMRRIKEVKKILDLDKENTLDYRKYLTKNRSINNKVLCYLAKREFNLLIIIMYKLFYIKSRWINR